MAKQWTASVLILALLGLAVWMFVLPKPTGTKLPYSKYYPESTSFYLELAPGEKLASRLLSALDEQYNGVDIQHASSGKLISRYDERFLPRFSIGTWALPRPKVILPPKEETPEAVSEKQTSEKITQIGAKHPEEAKGESDVKLLAAPLPPKQASLIVLTLKKETSASKLIMDFEGTLEHFDIHQEGEIPYLSHKDSEYSVAVVDQDLLITNGSRAMRTVLKRWNKNDSKNILENKLVKEFLPDLRDDRVGMMIVFNNPYTQIEQLETMPNKASAQIQKLSGKQEQLAKVVPITLAGIRVMDDEYLDMDIMVPLFVKNVGQDARQKMLRALYEKRVEFKAPMMVSQHASTYVGLGHLDKLYAMYEQEYMGPQDKATIKEYDSFLANIASMANTEISFNEDVVGLFSGELSFATGSSNLTPTIILGLDLEKGKSLKKIAKVLASDFVPVKHQTQRYGGVQAQQFSVPFFSEITMANFNQAMVITPSSMFDDILAIRKNEEKSLAESHEFRYLTRKFPKKLNLLFYSNFVRKQTELTEALGTDAVRENNQAQKQWMDYAAAGFWVKQKRDDLDVIKGVVSLKLSQAETLAAAN